MTNCCKFRMKRIITLFNDLEPNEIFELTFVIIV